ncbi:hypothetical protein Ade02nite_20070 [Paractinoplanes deccanensis]|uniref:DUF2637 domain-containing protein n=1 Tax=Paractinoplanes deccanensis TaxID=113561 RepID=A0ABQ3Y041_9ACTN|nr:hypothetical protein [Actinoplanes deccanensis]GID73366.1 hypothetical protein Ade02nite_20070 [Actinoplanes deccanensis]
MPTRIYALPDTPEPATTPAGYEGDDAWAQTVWAHLTASLETIPAAAWYTLAAAVIAAGLISSIRLALGSRDTTRRVKSDKFLTFLAAGVATGVVATGMWKFFGDVLHIANPYARVALFAFFEIAMLASAFRSRRFRLDRAAKRDTNPDYVEQRVDVDGIAVWVLAALSGLFAAADEHTTAGKAVRVVAPLLAAWMWERGLAGELMQFTRGQKRLNLRITPERALVWLGIAEPTDRAIGDVARKRRIAQFARTAYRLNRLVEDGKTGWRLKWTRWRLRRQTEAANEHLKLATDPALLAEVRAQLALLYGVEDGTSRLAVADLTPLRPTPRRELAATPFTPAPAPPTGDRDGDTTPAGYVATVPATAADEDVATADDTTAAIDHAARSANGGASETATDAAKSERPKPARTRASKPAATGAHPTAVKLAKYLAKYPGETNAELAKRMRVGDRTISRYRADAEALNARQQAAIPAPFPLPEPPVTAGVNGHHLTPEEN